MKRLYKVGLRFVRFEDVCRTDAPSNEELARFSEILAFQLESGVPLPRAVEILAETFQHPWFDLFCSLIVAATGSSQSTFEWVGNSIKRLVLEQVLLLSDKVKEDRADTPDPEDQLIFLDPDEDPTLEGQLLRIEEKLVCEGFNCVDFVIPDFSKSLGTLLCFMSVGASTGSLSKTLSRAAEFFRKSHQKDPPKIPMSDEVYLFLYGLSELAFHGVSLTESVKLMQEIPLQQDEAAIAKIAALLDEGCGLAKAMEKCGGHWANPMLVSLLQAGEDCNALDALLPGLLGLPAEERPAWLTMM